MRLEDVAGHPQFQSLRTLPGVAVDLRYASDNNFVGRNLYGSHDLAWLHVHAAQGVAQSVEWLRGHHATLTLAVLDALRPHRVQVELWDFLEGTPLRQYLADPARGSIHSFGMAVDVTLLDADGRELDMGTAFDALSVESHPQHESEHLRSGALRPIHIANRDILRAAMTRGGFRGISSEWWHFDHGDRERVRRDYLRVE
jgi:D-alanyl-D-alanine dipeptidase